METRRGRGVVVVMSIRSMVADWMYAGRKRYEFRRVRVSIQAGDVIVVYEPGPRSKVTGWFTAGHIATGSVHEMLGLAGDLERDLVASYLEGGRVCSAIEIIRPTRLALGLRLADIHPGVRPPQSYSYLESGTAAALLKRGVGAESVLH